MLAPPFVDNMADHFSVPTHATFFAGYLDAVGRQFTDGERLCMLSVVPYEKLLCTAWDSSLLFLAETFSARLAVYVPDPAQFFL